METKITDNIISTEFERNVCRLKGWTPEQRQIRLEELSKSINQQEKRDIKKEVLEIHYDENFFRRTNLSYSNPDKQLIEVSLLDYLLN